MLPASAAATVQNQACTALLEETSPLITLWHNSQATLQALFADDYAAWISPLKPLAATSFTLTLGAPTALFLGWVSTRAQAKIEAALSEAAGTPVTLLLQVAPTFASVQATSPAILPTAAPVLPAAASATPAVPEWLAGSRLDTRYTFSQFVTGKSNQFAFAAAQRVADGLLSGTVAFNPFFLHGGVGLGKTHLMQAVGQAVLHAKPGTNVLYLSAEQFLYKFIRALKDKNTLNFKEVFRNVDVLMIDDLQFIAGKDNTQEEFFHTFNALMAEGKQIILTADKSPHELTNIEERLKSRLGSGLTVEVHAPEEETRMAILQHKAESMGFGIPPEVIQLLASHIASNVRELEGALNRLVAYARLTGETLTPELAREQLRDLFRVYTRVITIEDIQQKVAAQFNIRTSDMHSPRRSREVARPRQVAMYLAKKFTSRSYPDIGRSFGGRDHTTVIHACEQVENLLSRDAQLAENVEILTRTLQGR